MEKTNWFNDKQVVTSEVIKSFDKRQHLTDTLNSGMVPFLNESAKEIHAANVEKGFYDETTTVGDKLMLITCEVAEAMEAYRKGSRANLDGYFKDADGFDKDAFQFHIKDTEEDEIADSIIRLLDYSAWRGIDIETHIRLKLAYNKTREHKHGKNL